jgi:hypothetical protein
MLVNSMFNFFVSSHLFKGVVSKAMFKFFVHTSIKAHSFPIGPVIADPATRTDHACTREDYNSKKKKTIHKK